MKIPNGILGGGSGSVGPVTIQQMKGQTIIRTKPFPRNPNSLKQQIARAKFKWANYYYKQFINTHWSGAWNELLGFSTKHNLWVNKILPHLDNLGNLSYPFQACYPRMFDFTGFFQATNSPEGNLQIQFSGWENLPFDHAQCLIIFWYSLTKDFFIPEGLQVSGNEEYFPTYTPKGLVLDDLYMLVCVKENTSEPPFKWHGSPLMYCGS